jgi:uncharacterized membrane protein YjfL (UPF0719 family)
MKTIIFIQFLLAFSIGIVSLFIIYRTTNFFMRKSYGVEEKNTAFAVFQAGIILSGSFILSSVVNPAVNAIRFLNQNNEIDFQSVGVSLGYVALFALIGIFCTMMVIAGGLFTLFQMTHNNEGEDIKNNNIATALITIAIIIGLSIIMDDYVGSLCEALIPYPAIPSFSN